MWEYKQGCFGINTVNNLGKEGWELIGTNIEHIQTAGEKQEVVIYYFKRKLPDGK